MDHPALIARLYDAQRGLFLPAVIPAIKERIPLTWTALAPLALPDLPAEIGHRLVEILLDERQFWTARRSSLGLARGACVLVAGALRRPAPLLARAHVGQQRMADLARHGAARLRAPRPGSRGRSPRPLRGKGFASSTTPTTAAGWAPRTSPGRRSRSKCSIRATRAPACPPAARSRGGLVQTGARRLRDGALRGWRLRLAAVD